LGRALRVMVDEMRAEPAPEPAWDERDEMERQLLQRIARREPPRFATSVAMGTPHTPVAPPSVLPRMFGFAAAAAAVALVLSSARPQEVAVHGPVVQPVDIANVPLSGDGDGDRDFDALAAGAALETTDDSVTFEQPGSVRWTLGPGSRAVVRAKGVRGVGHVVALERGWIRAEVTPRDASEGLVEAFAVEAEGTRVAVHGTLFTVTRLDGSILVDVDHGSVAVGPVGHQGITTGRLLVGPTRASFSFDGGRTARLIPRVTETPVAVAMVEPEPRRDFGLGTLAVEEPEPDEPRGPRALVNPPVAAPAVAAPANQHVAPPAPEAPVPAPADEPIDVEPPAKPQPKALTEAAVRAQLEQCFRHTAGSSSNVVVSFSSVAAIAVRGDGAITQVKFDTSLKPEFAQCAGSLYSLGKFEPGKPRVVRVPVSFTSR
jgi:hypothetical protein